MVRVRIYFMNNVLILLVSCCDSNILLFTQISVPASPSAEICMCIGMQEYYAPGGWGSYLDQLWDGDFMLPRVDGDHTWINYGIYSVLNFLLESWRKEASRWCVFYFFSSLLNQLIKIPWYVLSLYIIYPSRHLDVVLISLSSVRADLAYAANHYRAGLCFLFSPPSSIS